MRLSELITKLQTTLDANGDTENVGLGLVVGRTTKYRLDAFGDIDVLHDTAQFPTGMAMLVGEVQEGQRFPQLPAKPSNDKAHGGEPLRGEASPGATGSAARRPTGTDF